MFLWDDVPREAWNRLSEYIKEQLQNAERSGLLYFNIKANGAKCQAMLDSGATRTFGDLQYAKENGFEIKKLKESFMVNMANGNRVVCDSYMQVKLKFKQFSHCCDVYLMDLKGEHEIILGQDFLQARNPIIDWRERTMVLRKRHKCSGENDVDSVNYVDSVTLLHSGDIIRSQSKRTSVVDRSYAIDALNFISEGEPYDKREELYEKYGAQLEDNIISVKEFSKVLKRSYKNGRNRKGSPISENTPEYVCVWIYLSEDGKKIVSLSSMQDGESEVNRTREKYVEELENKYEDVFCTTLPPGVPPVRFPGAEFTINDGDPSNPPSAKVVRLTQSQLAELKVQLQYYLDKGFIRPPGSAYATPVFFVPKPHTNPIEWRMVCDYRALNKIDKRDAYPLPAIDTIIQSLKGAKVFSKLDLTQYFHQIPMHPDHIHKTAITTRYGNYEWLVVPFGLRNAPSAAQRLANTVFWDFLDEFLIVFMDDILIYAKTDEEMLHRIQLLLDRCRQWKIHVHPAKCDFFMDQLEYLGLGIFSDGMFITDQSKEAIRKWEIPNVPDKRNKKQNRRPNVDGKTAIRTFIGMVSFFRKFIPKLTEKLEPISRLLKPELKIPEDWGEEQQKAFELVKAALLSSEVLMLFDPAKNAVIYPDSSDVGVGGVLMQYDEVRKALRPISYMSSKLNDTQLRRSTYEKELWAMVKCFMVWKHYLADVETEVRSDHSPLKFFHSQAQLSDKIVRWLDFLSEFDFSVVHVPRELNTGADGFSKTPSFYGDAVMMLEAGLAVVIYTLSEIFEASNYYNYVHQCAAAVLQSAKVSSLNPSASADVGCSSVLATTRTFTTTFRRQIIDRVKAGYDTDPFIQKLIANPNRYPNYMLINDIWYRGDRKFGARVYVPARSTIMRHSRVLGTDGTGVLLRKHLLLEFHEAEFLGLHQGVRRTLRMLMRYFYWPGMGKDVYYHVQTCDKCQRVKARHTLPFGKYVGWKPPKRGWQSISLDIITDLPRTKYGNNAIHVTMDSRSRRVRLDAIPMEITAEGVGKLMFDTVIRDHGLPRVILHDNDPRYIARVWNTIWGKCGTHLLFTPTYHPISNSANERSHQVIEDALRCYVSNVELWDEHVPATEFAMNNQINADTGYTPFQIDCGQHPLDPIGVLLQETDDDGVLSDWKRAIGNHIQLYLEAQEKRLARINTNRIYPKFEAGQKVMMSTEFLRFADPNLRNKHLKHRYIGPVRVVWITKSKLAAKLDFSQYPDWRIHDVVPVSRLKPYNEERYGIRIYQDPPLPEIIDDVEYYKVESIVDRKYDRRRSSYKYLVKYLGYEAEHNQWLWEDLVIKSCADLVRSYNQKYPK